MSKYPGHDERLKKLEKRVSDLWMRSMTYSGDLGTLKNESLLQLMHRGSVMNGTTFESMRIAESRSSSLPMTPDTKEKLN